MVEVRAVAKYIRVSPRKARLTAKALKSLPPLTALEKLSFFNNKTAGSLAKVIKSALASAKNNFNLEEAGLKFKSIEVDKGPIFKRGRAVSRGRWHPIRKQTSHIKVVLEEIPSANNQ